MVNVERKIIIPEDFYLLPEDQQELISNELFQYLWGWKNNKHDKPISVNGEVYWIIQSPPPNRITFYFCNEEQTDIWKNDILFYQRPYARPIGVVDFYRNKFNRKKVDFQETARQICCDWREYNVTNGNREVEEWKVRRREIFVEHYGVDMPYHDPYEKMVA